MKCFSARETGLLHDDRHLHVSLRATQQCARFVVVQPRGSPDDAPAPVAQQPSLGTGHGRGEYSPVEQVAFERASKHPDELIAIRYERRETLVAMGVLPEPEYSFPRRHPDPVPGTLGFVPDP